MRWRRWRGSWRGCRGRGHDCRPQRHNVCRIPGGWIEPVRIASRLTICRCRSARLVDAAEPAFVICHTGLIALTKLWGTGSSSGHFEVAVHLCLRDSFLSLVDDTCRALDVPQPMPPQSHIDEPLTVRLDVDQTSFELSFHPDLPGDSFLLDCLMGPCPKGNDAVVGLLQANLELLRQEQGCLGWREDQDSIVLSTWVPMGDSSGVWLSEAMRSLAEQAAQWRSRVSIGGIGAER
jgi:hypothetical protein